MVFVLLIFFEIVEPYEHILKVKIKVLYFINLFKYFNYMNIIVNVFNSLKPFVCVFV